MLIFGMQAHLIDTHLLVPSSWSFAKVKVKYHGHVSQNMGVLGALLFYKHILFYLDSLSSIKHPTSESWHPHAVLLFVHRHMIKVIAISWLLLYTFPQREHHS